jgi:lipopolysaccharide transport system ATP-binding protein
MISTIRVEDLGKCYRVNNAEERPYYNTLRDTLARIATAPVRRWRSGGHAGVVEEFWALKDISFDVMQGEVVGIIGRNGAGKSTLLKILSRITKPTLGRAVLRGRVGSLLEVGTGFHQELTGRENIYMNGSVLGMTRQDIRRKFDEIVDFSGVERFLDTPVKRYSSGMQVRLAFSVAAHLDPEVLIVDEVLAVGDVEFQRKCLGKMHDVASCGRTVLFVSHNMSSLQQLCQRGIVLQGGRIVIDDEINGAVQGYLQILDEIAQRPLEENPSRTGSGDVRLVSVRTRDENGDATDKLIAGRPISFEFELVRHVETSRVLLGFTIFNELGMPCSHIHTGLHNSRIDDTKTTGTLVCQLKRLPLPVGSYRISVIIKANDRQADLILGCFRFQVIASEFFPSSEPPDLRHSPVLLEHQWSGTLLDVACYA